MVSFNLLSRPSLQQVHEYADKCQTGMTHLVARLPTTVKVKSWHSSRNQIVRSAVAVIGVAVIQLMMAIGLANAGVPAAFLGHLARLLIAIIQLPPISLLYYLRSSICSALNQRWCELVLSVV